MQHMQRNLSCVKKKTVKTSSCRSHMATPEAGGKARAHLSGPDPPPSGAAPSPGSQVVPSSYCSFFLTWAMLCVSLDNILIPFTAHRCHWDCFDVNNFPLSFHKEKKINLEPWIPASSVSLKHTQPLDWNVTQTVTRLLGSWDIFKIKLSCLLGCSVLFIWIIKPESELIIFKNAIIEGFWLSWCTLKAFRVSQCALTVQEQDLTGRAKGKCWTDYRL